MPNRPNISLDIRNSTQTDPGWVNIPASPGTNGVAYAYLYTGGDDGHGRIDVSKKNDPGVNTAQLALIADRRYQIVSCNFTDDTNNQLTWRGSSMYAGAIIDQNTALQNASYCILVKDTGNGDCQIKCDPGVINKPLPK